MSNLYILLVDFDDEVTEEVKPEATLALDGKGDDMPHPDLRGEKGAESLSSSSLSSDDDDEASTSMLSNAIFSALPKKTASASKTTQVKYDVY